MPKSTQEILDHADELSAAFDILGESVKDATALRALRGAVITRGNAERAVQQAVRAARQAGHSWASIGAMLGVSAQAATQRYGQ